MVVVLLAVGYEALAVYRLIQRNAQAAQEPAVWRKTQRRRYSVETPYVIVQVPCIDHTRALNTKQTRPIYSRSIEQKPGQFKAAGLL